MQTYLQLGHTTSFFCVLLWCGLPVLHLQMTRWYAEERKLVRQKIEAEGQDFTRKWNQSGYFSRKHDFSCWTSNTPLHLPHSRWSRTIMAISRSLQNVFIFLQATLLQQPSGETKQLYRQKHSSCHHCHLLIFTERLDIWTHSSFMRRQAHLLPLFIWNCTHTWLQNKPPPSVAELDATQEVPSVVWFL